MADVTVDGLWPCGSTEGNISGSCGTKCEVDRDLATDGSRGVSSVVSRSVPRRGGTGGRGPK
jgi:hypothetical protein